ncbi:MAG TPA: S8 family serine peptidase [Solirubrobacteraceae bacterium]|nr:S8 family serine peptidase [Solirubrobacteraceae bacterium]
MARLRTSIRRGVAPVLLAIAALAPLACSATAQGRGLGPEYTVRPACPAPSAGHASCLALAVRPRAAKARARVHDFATRTSPDAGLLEASECSRYQSSCFTPAQLRDAYFPGEAAEAPAGETQTIALVDAYNDPSAEADLAIYANEFGLPACTSENGCFKQVGQSGVEGTAGVPFPKTRSQLESFAKGNSEERAEAEEAEGWALEMATDVEMARAICHNCHILLVEADSPSYHDLEAAENTAATRAQEVSNSWGGPETGIDSPAFDHPGVVITASAGDDGYLNWDQYESREQAGSSYFKGANYPATSPDVVAVGGTSLTLSGTGAWQSESPWDGQGAGGSGCSGALSAPAWQLHVSDWAEVGCGSKRASADVAADADPATGVNVYDSIPYPYEEGHTTLLHWLPIGGTSVASPIVAAMFALAGGAHGVDYPAQTLYSHLGSALLHDVVGGGNGKCDGLYASCSGSMAPLSPLDCGAGVWICNATSGYDGPTGVGTPNGIAAFEPLVSEGPSEEGGPQGKGGQESGAGKEESIKEEAGKEEPPNKEEGLGTEGPAPPKKTTPPETGSTEATASVSSTPTNSTVSNQPASHGGTFAPARISRLQLTRHAARALRASAHPVAVDRLAFNFSLTRAVSVRALLSVRQRTRSGVRWRTLSVLVLSGRAGAQQRHLEGLQTLAVGSYRLTLTPLGGTPRSLTLRVGLRAPS